MNTLQCARYVYQTEGIRGFYRGLTASYAGISETIICFAIYENLKKYLKEAPLASSTNGTEKNSTNFFGLMAAAALSKGCASCVAYPHGRFCFSFRSRKIAISLCQCIQISVAQVDVQAPAGDRVAEPSSAGFSSRMQLTRAVGAPLYLAQQIVAKTRLCGIWALGCGTSDVSKEAKSLDFI